MRNPAARTTRLSHCQVTPARQNYCAHERLLSNPHGPGVFRVTVASMNERIAQHADAGIWHYETKFIDGIWEWEIVEKLKGKIASGHARTLGEAKAAMVAHTGRAPDGEWSNIGPDLPA